jgi:hypothetical protein
MLQIPQYDHHTLLNLEVCNNKLKSFMKALEG